MALNEHGLLIEVCCVERFLSHLGEESKWSKGLPNEYGTMYYCDVKHILTLGSLKDYLGVLEKGLWMVSSWVT